MHFDAGVTIKAATGAKVSFSKVEAVNISNVTFDGILFDQNEKSGTSKAFVFRDTDGVTVVNSTFDGTMTDGYGSGQGIWVTGGGDFTLENSKIDGFSVGGYFREVTGLTIRNNDLSDIGWDGMIAGKVHDVLIAGNEIDLHVRKGIKHTDGIQFWNTGPNDPSTDVTIRGNLVETNNTASHGIFMGNANGVIYGKDGAFRNVLIEDNTVISAQLSGLAWGRTDGLTIRNNTILQDPGLSSDELMRTPVIRVEKTSTGVEITGNATHVAPTSAETYNNFRADKVANPSWTIADNRIVARGTEADDIAGGAPGNAPKPIVSPEDPAGGNDRADTFRFVGKRAGAHEIDKIDFSEGDTLKLVNFLDGTFKHFGGGNKLVALKHGSAVNINSIDDLHELDAASGRVKIQDLGDDAIRITVTQPGAARHVFLLEDMAQDYASHWDATLL